MKIEIVGGDESVFRAAAFGLPDRNEIDRSCERLERFASGLSERARSFLGTARDKIHSLYDDTVRSTLRRLSRSKRGLYRDDNIQYLDSAEEVALAPMAMRRWILSHPRLRSLYDTQSTHAWGAKPGAFELDGKGFNDPYWQAQRNGIATKNEQGEWWTEYVYGACDVEGEEHLSLELQLDLIGTMDVIEDALNDGLDPLNPLGEKL